MGNAARAMDGPTAKMTQVQLDALSYSETHDCNIVIEDGFVIVTSKHRMIVGHAERVFIPISAWLGMTGQLLMAMSQAPVPSRV